MKRLNLTKFGGTKMKESSSNKGAKTQNFNHLRWTDEIFGIDIMKIR